MSPEESTMNDGIEKNDSEYKIILDALGDAIHVVDKNLEIIYQNPAFSEWLISLELEKCIVGKKLRDAFPFLSEETVDEYRHVFTTGEMHVIKETTNLNDAEITVEVRKVPIFEEEIVTKIITILRDITEQTEARKQLQKSEERYRRLYRDLSDALFQTDVNGRIVMAGEKAKVIFGYEKDELIGMPFTMLLAPEEIPRVFEAFKQKLITREENLEGLEADGIRKDGTRFRFHITNTILFEENRPIGYQSLVRDVTELKKAELEIAQKEERYRALFEQNNDAVFILDLDGNHIEMNQQAIEMVGYTREELVGQHIFNIIADEPSAGNDHPQNLLDVGEVPIQEINFRKRNDIGFPGEVRVSLIRDPTDCPLYYQLIVRDISERKRIESEIKEEHARAQMYLDIAGVMLVALNVDGDITLINQKGCEILGYTEDELINKNWFDTVLPDDAKESTRNVFRLLMLDEGEHVTHFDNTIITRSGDMRLISWQNEVLRGTDGMIIGTLSSGEDITERQRIMHALRTEKERYQILFETAPIAIAVTNDHGEFFAANWAFQELLGYSLDELMSMNALETYVNHLDRDRLTLTLEKEGKVRNFDAVLQKKDGERIDTLLNIDYVDYDNRIVRLTTVRDITELNQIRRELEEARARAEFFADLLAHDLNNVHQGILVGAELLLMDQELNETTRSHGTAIREQVARGIDLIDNVRKLSRMEAEMAPKLIEVDLHSILANALMLAQHAFPLKKSHFDIKFRPGQVIVLADEFLIDLFYNMIHNAMKYDTSDEIDIEIEIQKGIKAGFVSVAVMDNGPGIPPDRREDIFSRLEKGRTLGSGMGLTLVKHIAERYGGRTWVEDRVPGMHSKGSKFIVELPILRSP